MIISIVSASSFFGCLGLGCKNSSKSRAWIFGKEHMIVILKLYLIIFYELVVHCKRKKWLSEARGSLRKRRIVDYSLRNGLNSEFVKLHALQ